MCSQFIGHIMQGANIGDGNKNSLQKVMLSENEGYDVCGVLMHFQLVQYN